MAKPRRTIKYRDIGAISEALAHLKRARRCLKTAGAKQAARYVARATKSVEGAFNHAQSLWRAQERQTQADYRESMYPRAVGRVRIIVKRDAEGMKERRRVARAAQP